MTIVNISNAAQAALECLNGEGATPLQMAQEVAVQAAATSFLEALTGLKGSSAIEQGERWAEDPAQVAYVAPF
jgi:hypothetical protein